MGSVEMNCSQPGTPLSLWPNPPGHLQAYGAACYHLTLGSWSQQPISPFHVHPLESHFASPNLSFLFKQK